MTDKGTNQEMKSTVAKYYTSLIGDFKTNEKKIMTELDDLGKKFAKSKKGDMGSAVEGTEAIREW